MNAGVSSLAVEYPGQASCRIPHKVRLRGLVQLALGRSSGAQAREV